MESLGEVMGRLAAEFTTRPEGPAARPANTATSPEFFARGFVSTLALIAADDLLAACRDRPPELVVREVNEFGCHLVAEDLAALDAQRARFGLPPLEPGRVWGRGRIGVVPEAFYPASRRPAGAGYFQVPSPPRPAPLTQAIAELPSNLFITHPGFNSVREAVARLGASVARHSSAATGADSPSAQGGFDDGEGAGGGDDVVDGEPGAVE